MTFDTVKRIMGMLLSTLIQRDLHTAGGAINSVCWDVEQQKASSKNDGRQRLKRKREKQRQRQRQRQGEKEKKREMRRSQRRETMTRIMMMMEVS